ncbi:ATP-binding protein [Actinomadura macrotermitis]|uniref:OmpR/PhoB-type domain-containing protein n=1 Tax=Actinomadura macrotermitis TaxID=2585200 RepID=A0A7K0BX79_9ACTN|nr:BTAD domain-containing putative transcriptional regulator [Actinomadura macrotermitis]MQY05793.1 hypothetical protein [Actinomadura macrotermitis]
MRFGVLGETRAWHDDGTEVMLGGPARRALLALLLARPGEAVPAGRLIEDLYGDPEAGNALQAQVSRLRRAVPVEHTPAGYRVAAAPEDVDAGRFERLADEGRAALRAGDPARAAVLLREGLGLWRGEAFADFPDHPAGARLAERRLAAVEDRIEADLARGEPTGLVAELRELVAAHPLRERARELLMRALRAEGRPAEALAAFAETRQMLADELGADPSPGLAGLHRELLRGGPAAPPAPLTGFVGRDEDLAAVARLLRTARLVTLLGPGGVGKTRLAVEAAAAHPGEVCFVALAPLRDPADLPRAILAALGLPETGLLAPAAADPLARAAAALAERPPLLVIDNCEHLVEAAAGAVWRLLSDCPDLRVLATSREALGITGEHLWPVRPLPGDAAVRLFADRAAAVRPGFIPGDQVRAVCRALDDLPLAIELAAARLRSLDVAALAAGLDDRFALLARGSRAGDARHRTLRAVVVWSWDLLDEPERRVAHRFTAFAGGATAASARAVCGGPGVDAVLESLVDKSLLEVAGGRYRMLETIRAYAVEQPGEDASRAHAEHFLALAQTAAPHLVDEGQPHWLGVLAAEHDNLLAALRWAVRAQAVDIALPLLGSISTYLWIKGVAGAAASLAAELLRLPPRPGLEEEYVACVLVAGGDRDQVHAAARLLTASRSRRYPFLAFRWLLAHAVDGDLGAAFALLTAERDGPHPWSRAAAHMMLGFPELAAGRLEAAEREFAEAAASFGDHWGKAMTLDALAGVAALRGDDARALALTDEALALTEGLGAVEDRADLLCNRGDFQRDPAAARADYEAAAALARRAGSPTYLAAALRGLGDAAFRDGDLAAAGRLYRDALDRFDPAWMKSVGNRVRALTGLGRIAAAEGDPAAACARYLEAVEAGTTVGATFESARGVLALAELALGEGDAEGAARLLGAAAALRGVPVDESDVASSARAVLGDAAYTAAYETGARLSHADALRLAGLHEAAVNRALAVTP